MRARARQSTVACAAFLVVAAAGCGAGDGSADAGPEVRIDTARGGVERVTNAGEGLWSSGEPWRVDLAGALELGELDGPEAYTFGRIAGVLVGEDDRIYVADADALEIRIFSPEGELLGRFGRDGEGPGEFGYLGGLGQAPGGGVAALDGRLGRVTIFDPDGAFERSFRLERAYATLMAGTPVPFDRNGRFYDVGSISPTVEVDSLGAIRYGADGAVEDTILLAVYEPARVIHHEDGVPRMSMPIPYAPRPSSAVGPDGEIYATMGAEYRIARLAPEGDTVRVIRREWEPPPVTEAERDSALAALRERFRDAVGADPRDPPTIPERKPAITSMRVDALGHLWVMRSFDLSADRTEWDVFDPEGRYLGEMVLPAMVVLHVGERTIAGYARGPMGVPRVRVIPLDRGGAGVRTEAAS